MFYSQLLMAKKGPLARIWLAAHWDRKLSKAIIAQTDIKQAAEQVKKPATPLSLRTAGHLLLGVARIYAKKVQYLYSDSNETYHRLNSTLKPSEVDLLDADAGSSANINMDPISMTSMDPPPLTSVDIFQNLGLPFESDEVIDINSSFVGNADNTSLRSRRSDIHMKNRIYSGFLHESAEDDTVDGSVSMSRSYAGSDEIEVLRRSESTPLNENSPFSTTMSRKSKGPGSNSGSGTDEESNRSQLDLSNQSSTKVRQLRKSLLGAQSDLNIDLNMNMSMGSGFGGADGALDLGMDLGLGDLSMLDDNMMQSADNGPVDDVMADEDVPAVRSKRSLTRSAMDIGLDVDTDAPTSATSVSDNLERQNRLTQLAQARREAAGRRRAQARVAASAARTEDDSITLSSSLMKEWLADSTPITSGVARPAAIVSGAVRALTVAHARMHSSSEVSAGSVPTARARASAHASTGIAGFRARFASVTESAFSADSAAQSVSDAVWNVVSASSVETTAGRNANQDNVTLLADSLLRLSCRRQALASSPLGCSPVSLPSILGLSSSVESVSKSKTPNALESRTAAVSALRRAGTLGVGRGAASLNPRLSCLVENHLFAVNPSTGAPLYLASRSRPAGSPNAVAPAIGVSSGVAAASSSRRSSTSVDATTPSRLSVQQARTPLQEQELLLLLEPSPSPAKASKRKSSTTVTPETTEVDMNLDEYYGTMALGGGGLDDMNQSLNESISSGRPSLLQRLSVGSDARALLHSQDPASMDTQQQEAFSTLEARMKGNLGSEADVQSEHSSLAEGELFGASVSSEKWHPQTVAIFRALASIMTGPTDAYDVAKEYASLAQGTPLFGGDADSSNLPKKGKKRLSATDTDHTDDNVPIVSVAEGGNLKSLMYGKGSRMNPISFEDIAEGVSRRVAVTSFFQLLVLKSWDIIDVQQGASFSDIFISRTSRFHTALMEH